MMLLEFEYRCGTTIRQWYPLSMKIVDIHQVMGDGLCNLVILETRRF